MSTKLTSILIFRPSPFGRMYLCRDGSLSNNRADAAEHWATQFNAIVAENWIVNGPELACAEIVMTHCRHGVPDSWKYPPCDYCP